MRVLVVDDESAIRHLVDRLLTGRGDVVITAPDAVHASALLLDYGHPIDVALLDLLLPGIGGLAYADQLAQQFPSSRIVFMTGMVEETTLVEAERRAPLLLKPFRKDQLFAIVGS